jgi:glycolate oxidase iron-sulfur subunit
MDTPRGRIVLMKEVLEGTLPLTQALPHVDRCLGCLACETACPSGVKYRELISPFRDHVRENRPRTFLDRLKRRLLLETLPHPWRFRLAAKSGILTKPLHGLLPRMLRPMLGLLPDKLPEAQKLAPFYPAQGPRRARVALLAGCAQQVLAPEINAATIAVLTKNGVEVTVPESQGCCGALAWHVGAGDEARKAARKNLQAFNGEVDAIVTNAAGCGSGLHEYPLMLQGTPDEAAAKEFAHRVVDVSVFLDRLGIVPPPPLKKPVTVAYHDACHLSHAQGVRSAPRDLLRQIPGLVLKEIADGDICCGSAGTYNVDQPDIAAGLGRKKASNIAATGAAYVVMGNIGCMTQIASHLRSLGNTPRVLHTMELLAMACEGRL